MTPRGARGARALKGYRRLPGAPAAGARGSCVLRGSHRFPGGLPGAPRGFAAGALVGWIAPACILNH
eukprot:9501508-Pyramimonas_sp.AAC.1